MWWGLMCQEPTADRITAPIMAHMDRTTEASSSLGDTTIIITTVGIISTDMVSAPVILEAGFITEIDECTNRFAADPPNWRWSIQGNRAPIAKAWFAGSTHCHGWLLCQAGISTPAQRNPQAIWHRRYRHLFRQRPRPDYFLA